MEKAIAVRLSDYEWARLRGMMLVTQESASAFIRKAIGGYLSARGVSYE